MRKRLPLLLWLLGVLFPMAWLGRFSPTYQRIFDAIFSPPWMHVVMHAALFAGLVLLLAWTWPIRQPWRFLLVVLLVGLFQETFQGWSQGGNPLSAVLFDLIVDLSGGVAGLALVVALKNVNKYTRKQENSS